MGWIDKIIANIGAMPPEEIIWLSIGFLGQFLFAMRFIIQW
ncbi:MAG TPA: lipid-A-disaccharide synthase, partial [Rhodospirillaceae bacterium]|nr:lipid-A-disaccharide synthase [Rhodospirillaceae bacterium]